MLINMCVLNFGLFYLVGICILSTDFSNADVHIANWDHDHHHTHSELWEGTCKVGEHQSPIDIVSNEMDVVFKFDRLKFKALIIMNSFP